MKCNNCKWKGTEKELKECWGNSLYAKTTVIGFIGYECPYCRGNKKGLIK